MSEVEVSPDAASIARFDTAVAPSLEILDNVISVGDPYWQAVAQDAKRDILVGLIVRERVSLQGDISAHDNLEAMLMPWQGAARTATEAIETIARQDPTLAQRDAVMANLIARMPSEPKSSQMAKLAR